MNRQIKKVNPADLPEKVIRQMYVQHFGKDWVKFCNDTFEGGYNAVHKVLGGGVVTKNKNNGAKVVFTTTRKKNAVERSITILSKGVYTMNHSSRKFLCQNVQFGRFDLSEKQEKWLSDLEKRFGV